MAILFGCGGAVSAAAPQVASGHDFSVGLSSDGRVYVGGGGTALTDYIASKNYLDFTQRNKTLGNGTGFWVNR